MDKKTPYFVLETKKLEQNYLNFLSLCEKFLGEKGFEIAYSVKTNSHEKVLAELEKLGSGFECSSLREMKLVSKKNKKGFKILNGPAKNESELNYALEKDFMVIADSIKEIQAIETIAKLKKKRAEVGIRISFEKSKFGIFSENLKKAIENLNLEHVKVVCLHYHQGTQTSLKKYETNLKKLADFLKNNNLKFDYLDLGGGFPDQEYLKSQNTNLEQYFSLIKKYFSNNKARIILEPGRVLVNNAMHLITRVIRIKEEKENLVILDAGINYLPKITLSHYIFSKFNSEKEKNLNKQTYTLAGPLLFSNDILGKFQGNLSEGDLIRVDNVGAYCLALSWDIGYGKPKVIVD